MDTGKHLLNLWLTLITVELPETNQANRKQRNITIQLTSNQNSTLTHYQYLLDQAAGLLKSGNKKAFTSLFVPETEMVQYRAPIQSKMVPFKTEMT